MPRIPKEGLPQTVVDALLSRARPAFENTEDEAIYDFCMELHQGHAISEKTHEYCRAG